MIRTLFFTNIVAPYRVGFFNELSLVFSGNIKIYFDSVLEKNRDWNINLKELICNYEVKNTFSIPYKLKVNNNTIVQSYIYVPIYIFKECFKNRPQNIISLEFGLRTIFSLISAKLIGSRVLVFSDVTPFTEKNISFFRYLIRRIISKYADGGIANSKLSEKYLKSLRIKNTTISPYAIDNEYYIQKSKKIIKK